MGSLLDILAGQKTYIVAIAAAVITILHNMGRIDDNTFATLMALLGSAGLATLRHAVATEKKS